MDALLRRLATVFAILGSAVALATGLMTLASVVGRAALSAPIPGDVELTQFGIALAISLGLPWCQLKRANIIVDFFTQRLSPRRLQGLDGIRTVVRESFPLETFQPKDRGPWQEAWKRFQGLRQAQGKPT